MFTSSTPAAVRLPLVEALESRQLLSAAAPTTRFVETDLVSDIPGRAAHTDPNLVNPWGTAADDHGPTWVANNGTGTATLYDFFTGAKQPLTVNIPGHGGPAAPTGQVYNSSDAGFTVHKGGKTGSSAFIFVSEDGTISGWSPSVDLHNAVVAVDNNAHGAVYKGLAIAQVKGKTYLFATNFGQGRVDVFDSHFHRVTKFGSFHDKALPHGYVPFGIQNLNGNIVVTYALKANPGDHDEAHGAGLGHVTEFSASGKRLISFQGTADLDAPWGIVTAPQHFMDYAGDVLIGNFGSGQITAFNASNGTEIGTLKKPNGDPVQISGLWALETGNSSATDGTVFFTAGINDEADGLYGKLNNA